MYPDSEWDHVYGKRVATSKLWVEGNLEPKYLYYLSKIINPTKNTKIIHCVPVLWGETNGRLRKSRFNPLRNILDSGASSYIILGKNMQRL